MPLDPVHRFSSCWASLHLARFCGPAITTTTTTTTTENPAAKYISGGSSLTRQANPAVGEDCARLNGTSTSCTAPIGLCILKTRRWWGQTWLRFATPAQGRYRYLTRQFATSRGLSGTAIRRFPDGMVSKSPKPSQQWTRITYAPRRNLVRVSACKRLPQHPSPQSPRLGRPPSLAASPSSLVVQFVLGLQFAHFLSLVGPFSVRLAHDHQPPR
ncbi:hypothetical protein CKAH01_14540 [Colletotrichum kahawae]|uniref:Uncharacterized protein n=1 Tax=Colletotrichum kahawae TaxID=34407 RepID=A0AAD9YLZ9_COLKA|nr:hypothetical protein CKAH01_14540 [Colletotrichum kahawae]